MGRKRTFEIDKYVTVDSENNSECILCKKYLKGVLSGNIKRHFKSMHNILINGDDESEKCVKKLLSNGVSKNQLNSQIQTSLNKKEFMLCCVGLVAVKNMPLKIFDDDEYFKKILRPYEDFYNININSKNIVSEINTAANELKQYITKAVSEKLICLKFDVATCLEKSVLGIHVQYIKDSKININTIGAVQLKKQFTTQFLKKEIINCLNEFKIDTSQIYACTSDDGANLTNTSNLLQELQEEVLTKVFEDPKTNNEEFNEIHSSISSFMDVVRCASHSIQLAAHDVLKTIQPELNKCRKIVKDLPSIVQNDGLENFPMPQIDNTMRWSSTYEMIKQLENFKEYVNTSESDFYFISQFVNAFNPLSECIRKFQQEQYIFGDFYRDWLCCEVELEEIANDNIYAKNLLNSMKKRKKQLLVDKVFISAIYLDPRFNFTRTPFLLDEHKKIAVNHLLKTYNMIKGLEEQYANVKKEFNSSKCLPEYSGNFSKLEAKMDLLIKQSLPSDRTIKQKLENFCNAERVSFDTNILEYRKSTIITDPGLEKLLDISLSIPSTQVSFERTFSALSVILTKIRTNSSKDIVNNLLLVKLNKNIIDHLINSDKNNDK